jgi:hypothetical protein
VFFVRKGIILLQFDLGHLDLYLLQGGRKDGSYLAALCRVIDAPSITFRGKRTENGDWCAEPATPFDWY